MNIFSKTAIDRPDARIIVPAKGQRKQRKTPDVPLLHAHGYPQGYAEHGTTLPHTLNGNLQTPELVNNRSQTTTPDGTPCPPEKSHRSPSVAETSARAITVRSQEGQKATFNKFEGEKAFAARGSTFRIHEDSSDSIEHYPSPLSMRNDSSEDRIASSSSDTQGELQQQTEPKPGPEPATKKRKTVAFVLPENDTGEASETTPTQESGRPINEISQEARYENYEKQRANEYKADMMCEEEYRLLSLHRSNRHNNNRPEGWDLPQNLRPGYAQQMPKSTTLPAHQSQAAASQVPTAGVTASRSDLAPSSPLSPVLPVNAPEDEFDSDPLELGDPFGDDSTSHDRHSTLYPIDRFNPDSAINHQLFNGHNYVRKPDPFPNLIKYRNSTLEEMEDRLEAEQRLRAQGQAHPHPFLGVGRNVEGTRVTNAGLDPNWWNLVNWDL